MLTRKHSGRNDQRGVTLVELMVGLAILSTLLALAAPFAGSMINNAKIRTAAETILSGLQLARSTAVNLNTQVQFVLSNGTDSSWTVACVNSTTAGCVNLQTGLPPVQSHTAAEGVSQAALAADQTTVVFNGFGAATPAANICVGSAGSTLTAACSPASNPTTERRLKVTVGTSGTVRMCDPALPAYPADSQGC